jgi:hypothetical protein
MPSTSCLSIDNLFRLLRFGLLRVDDCALMTAL